MTQFLGNAADFFLLKEHLKRNWALKGQSKSTWALEYSKGTWLLKALGHSEGTSELGHSRHSMHFI